MGFNTLKESECLFSEERKIGNDLANENGKIEYLVFNDRRLKWHYMGEFIGNMNVIDYSGCLCRISDDFQNMQNMWMHCNRPTKWEAVQDLLSHTDDRKVRKVIKNFSSDLRQLSIFRKDILI